MENDFLIYLGTDICERELKEHLSQFKRSLATVRSLKEEKYTFVNLVRDYCPERRQPHFKGGRICSFKGNYNNLDRLRSKYIDKIDDLTDDIDCFAEILIDIYNKYGKDLFVELFMRMPFVFSLYDIVNENFIVLRGNKESDFDEEEIPLFYGYTKRENLMFATKREFLEEYCSEILELENGQCFYNGEFISFKELLRKEKAMDAKRKMLEPYVEMLREVVKNFNTQLFNVSNENVALRINEIINEQTQKNDIITTIDNSVREKLISEITEKVVEEFKQEISEQKIVEISLKKAKQQIQGKIDDYLMSKISSIQKNYSEKMGREYISNTCENCGVMQGINYVVYDPIELENLSYDELKKNIFMKVDINDIHLTDKDIKKIFIIVKGIFNIGNPND